MSERKLPFVVNIEIKDAGQLKEDLKDINGNPLPSEGIVIKRVTHSSPEPKIDYIVPESNNFYNYLSKKLAEIDMSDFLQKANELCK